VNATRASSWSTSNTQSWGGLANDRCDPSRAGYLQLEELFPAIRRFFEALTRWQPLVVVLEDVHWAEATLLDLIEYLTTAVWERVFPLCLARPDILEEAPRVGNPESERRPPAPRAARLKRDRANRAAIGERHAPAGDAGRTSSRPRKVTRCSLIRSGPCPLLRLVPSCPCQRHIPALRTCHWVRPAHLVASSEVKHNVKRKEPRAPQVPRPNLSGPPGGATPDGPGIPANWEQESR
jgi:hypothetical protein